MSKSRIVSAVALLGCAAALAACGSSSSSSSSSSSTVAANSSASSSGSSTGAATGSPITIALDGMKITGLDLLTQETAGAQAAVNKINAEGGFGGHKVVLAVCNSMVAAAPTTECAHKLVTSHPLAMIGCELNWGTSGAVQLFAAAHIPSFNCVNTTQDYTNPWNFGIQDGGYGDVRGTANWLCSQSNVHTVGVITADVPAEHQVVPQAMSPLAKCGKKVNIIYFPPVATDYGPYVAKMVATHPDFVQLQAPSPPAALELIKNLHQAGFPSDHIGAASSGFDPNAWKAAGATLNGIHVQLEGFDSWNDTSNPDVAAYVKAMQASPQTAGTTNIDSVNSETGYSDVMWLYTLGKTIGFDKLTGSAIANFMRTHNGIHIPLSRSLVNPGPKGYAQDKQPYTSLAQWENGKLVLVTNGTQNGFVYGY